MENSMDIVNSDNNFQISIPGIDTLAGINYCGSTEMYIDLLRDIYEIIDKKSDETQKYLEEKDLKSFTTSVHSLKTTCRMMGHTNLSERFYELEKLGKEGALEKAATLTNDVLKCFRDLKPLLEPYIDKKEAEKIPFSAKEFHELLEEIKVSTADFDINRAEAAIQRLLTYECDNTLSDQLLRLSTLINDLDYDEASMLASTLAETV